MTKNPQTPPAPPETKGGSLADFYSTNGITWGAADLFMVGEHNAQNRVAEFLGILRTISHPDGRPALRTIVVMLPPFEKEPAAYLTELRAAFPAAVEALRGRSATADEVRIAFANIFCQRSDTLDAASLIALTGQLAPNSAAIITHAALYRAAGVGPNGYGVTVPDDIWTPHLRSLIQDLEIRAVEMEAYVVVDAGSFLPWRKENLDALMTLDSCVTGTSDSGRSPLTIVDEVQRWTALAAEGNLGTMTAEIEAIDGLSNRRKALVRLQMLSSAGLGLEVKKEIESRPDLTANLDPETALKVAVLANDCGAHSTAEELLSRAADGLQSQEDVELALNVADDIGNSKLFATFERKLSLLFPASNGLRRHRLFSQLQVRNYEAAATLFDPPRSDSDRESRDYFHDLSECLNETRDADVEAELKRLSDRYPSRHANSLRACARYLEARGQRGQAVMMLVNGAADKSLSGDRAIAGLALDMIERGLLLLDPQIENDIVFKIVKWVAVKLAGSPQDGALRSRIAKLTSPEVLGSNGLPMIAAVVVSLFAKPITPRPTRPVNEWPRACSPEELEVLLERGMRFLAEQRPIVIGKRVFPSESLNVSAGSALAGLSRLVEHMGRNIAEDGDVQTMEACVAIAGAIAPLSAEPNGDLLVLRLAALSLTTAGRVQRARDLAEQALNIAREDPLRQRHAWFVFADVYARQGNLGEALIALACCSVADPTPSWDQVWYETLLLLRIFRDLGMIPLALPLIEPARRALIEMRAPSHYSFRLETTELQMRLLELDAAKAPDRSQIAILVSDLDRNVRQIMEVHDEIEPVAALFANALRLADEQQVSVPESSSSLLTEILTLVSSTSRGLIEATAVIRPSVGQLVPLVHRMEQARYAEDVGFDVRHLVIVARRVLARSLDMNVEDAIYASEVLTDQAMAVSLVESQPRFLSDDRARPANAARALSKLGISVVTLANTDAGLVRTISSGGQAYGPIVESVSVFSKERLARWSENYPVSYKRVADVNEFYLSTDGIGVSELPDRSVVIASTDMQGFPPNLLNVACDLAGRTRRLASAPSLAWLDAKMREGQYKFDGRIAAWIPDAAPDGHLPTLAIVSERLHDSFVRHQVVLSNGASPPEGLAGAGMVIVAAHGGLADDARYFRVVTDDVDLAIASSTLSGSLSGVGVVVLFVCSGGRLDKHPGGSTTVGLAKSLLNRGCGAVIAPPWPLDSSIPPYWLPTFLAAWSNGESVLDACFEANERVRSIMGDDPAKYLAMSVYGNPMMRTSVRN